MRIKIFTLLAFLWTVTLLPAQAPSWNWAKSAGGSGYEEASKIATDAAGNVFVVGTFGSATITIGTTTLTSAGSPDVFLAKYDSSGNALWAKSIGGNGNDGIGNIATDPSGNVFVAGYFNSSTLTIGSNTLTNGGGSDVFFAKYSPGGNVIWAKRCGSSGYDESDAIATDGNGNLLMVGIYQNATMNIGNISLSSSGDNDGFVAKFDTAGNVLWAKAAHGGGIDDAVGITSDFCNNVYITGYATSSDMTFGGNVTLTNSGSGNIFVAKYDNAGNALWARNSSAGGAGFSYNSIRSDRYGNEYVIGNLFSTLTFGSQTLNTGGGADAFIVKYDGAGNVVWAKSVSGTGDETGTDLAVDAHANVFATGYSTSATLTVGSSTLTNSGGPDIYIAKLDSSGNGSWAVNAQGSIDDMGKGVAVDGGGNVLFAGAFYSSSITFGSTTLNNNGNWDMAVAKLGNKPIAPGFVNAAGQVSITPPGPVSLCQGDSVTLTASAATSYHWSNSATTQSITVKLANSYTVSVTFSGTCNAVSPPVNVSFSATGNAGTISALQNPVCSDSAVQLSLSGNSGTPLHWQVSSTPNAFVDIPGAADTVYNDSLKGTYYFRVYVGAGSCADTSAAFPMTVNPLPVPGIPTSPDSIICSSDSARVDLAGNYTSYLWNNGDTRPYTYARQAGGYWVTVTDANSCTAVSGHLLMSIHPIPSVSLIVQGDTLSSLNAVSYRWFRNDTLLPSATSSVLIADQTGDYAVEITDTNGCTAISNSVHIVVTPTGIDERYISSGIAIYPNPTSGEVLITMSQGEAIAEVHAYNMMGQEVKSEIIQTATSTRAKMDLSDLPSGVYLLMLFNESQFVGSKRVVLETSLFGR